ncbi:MAG TPA: hypothetical protein VGI12_11500 [Vicinamibacterales bacterium]|jgi:uncharacterized membrane protein
MFYFFSRGSSFVRCEIRPPEGDRGYEIVVAEPGTAERVSSFASSDQAHQHWLRLQEEFNAQGWWGPHGRE